MKNEWTRLDQKRYYQKRIIHPWKGKTHEFISSEFSRLDRILNKFGMWYGDKFKSMGHSLLGYEPNFETTYEELEAGEARLREMYERRCRLGGILGRRYGLIIN